MARLSILLCLAVSIGCPKKKHRPPPSTVDAGVPVEPALEPTEPASLSSGGTAEDPTVIRRHDGSIAVAYFEDVDGNEDIYLRTAEAQTLDWSDPDRVSSHEHKDKYPNLYEDDAGVLHVVWYRREPPPTNYAYIMHRELGPEGWSESERLDDEAVQDIVPTITGLADGTLLVYHVTDKGADNGLNDLYVTLRDPATGQWSERQALPPEINTADTEHVPYAVRTSDGGVTLTWMRYASSSWPWLDDSSEIYTATTQDGLSYADVTAFTDNGPGVVDIFPAVYQDTSEDWHMVWLQHAKIAAASVSRSLSGEVGTLEQLPLPSAGYSLRIAPTATDDIAIAVWVQASPSGAEIAYQLFAESDSTVPLCSPESTAPRELTFGDSDEDGMFVTGPDGKHYLVWITGRNGTIDLYVKDSVDGESWSEERPAIATPSTDMMNNVFVDNGALVVTGRTGGNVSELAVSSSADGVSWDAPELLVDLGLTKPFGAMARKDSDGRFWVVYSQEVDGNRDLYVRHSDDDGDNWSVPTRISTDPRSDGYGYFHIAGDGTLAVAWTRWEGDPVLPFQSPTTEVVVATSQDGITWSETQITNDTSDPKLDMPPAVLEGPGGLYVGWLTTSLYLDNNGDGTPEPAPGLVVQPVSAGSDLSQLRYVPDGGYSPRTHDLGDGRFLIAYVRSNPTRNLRYRIVCNFDFLPAPLAP